MAYAKCFGPSILEGVDRALYVDFGMLAVKSI